MKDSVCIVMCCSVLVLVETGGPQIISYNHIGDSVENELYILSIGSTR